MKGSWITISKLSFAMDPFWNELRFREDVTQMTFGGETIAQHCQNSLKYVRENEIIDHAAVSVIKTFIRENFNTELSRGLSKYCNHSVEFDGAANVKTEWQHPKIWFNGFA